MNHSSKQWMHEALNLAHKAATIGEVPIGALVVKDSQVVGRGFNQVISRNDPCAHAEILALREAGAATGNYRLTDCEVYTTLEPCPMCAGALVHGRIKRLFIGTKDPKTGACGSVFNLTQGAPLNHKIEVQFGLLEQDCTKILQGFFQDKRRK